mmetsp:Transcript_4552/g.15917  ORF Transcript_4552/g.15917 Transcript_4552/m.15917 type:complete len:111 (-) Transcript_4552:1738-2070(-)
MHKGAVVCLPIPADCCIDTSNPELTAPSLECSACCIHMKSGLHGLLVCSSEKARAASTATAYLAKNLGASSSCDNATGYSGHKRRGIESENKSGPPAEKGSGDGAGSHAL